MAEIGHGLFARGLLDVAMQAVGADARAAQVVAQALAHDLRVAEHDHALKGAGAQDAQHGLFLLQPRDRDRILIDIRLTLLRRGNGDLHLVALVHPADSHDLLRDRRGEQAEVRTVLDAVENFRHIIEEAHVQHAVRLVENDGLDAVEAQVLAVIVVHEATRRRHDDLRMLLQAADLRLKPLAAIDDRHTDILIKCEQAAQLVGDLDGQLARRGQDQALQIVGLRIDMLDHRDAKGKRLARSRRRLGDDVAPRQQRRDGLLLHARRHCDALLFQRTEDLLADTELLKCLCRFHTSSPTYIQLVKKVPPGLFRQAASGIAK